MSDNKNPQPDEAELPEPQDVQEEQQFRETTPTTPYQEPDRPADTGGYDMPAGSQRATRGASGHRR